MEKYCLKIVISTFLMLIAGQSSAAFESNNAFQNGFYAGGALGAGWGLSDWEGVSNTLTAINNQAASLMISESWTPDGNTSMTEFVGRAELGYQLVHLPFYLAGEISGTFSKKYHFDIQDNKTFEVESLSGPNLSVLSANAVLNDTATLGGAELDLDLKPGLLFVPNILTYTRIGLAVNKLSIENADAWTNTSSSPPYFPEVHSITASGFSKITNTVCGIRLGLGTEYLVTQNIGVSLDYTYTNYGRITTTSRAFASTAPYVPPTSPYYAIGGIDAPDVGISTQVVTLGILYHI